MEPRSSHVLTRLSERERRGTIACLACLVAGGGTWIVLFTLAFTGTLSPSSVTAKVLDNVGLGFLAVAAVLSLFVSRWHRTKARIAARRCAACDYDLRAHAVGQRCPECGAPVG